MFRHFVFAGILLSLSGANARTEEYTRTALHDIYRQTRNGGMDTPAEALDLDTRLVVIGTPIQTDSKIGTSSWILIGQMGVCCNFFSVGIPIRGTNTFVKGEWIAAYGHLDRSGSEWTASMVHHNNKMIHLGGDDLGLHVERTAPASDVIYTNNAYTLLGGEKVKSFQRAVNRGKLAEPLQLIDNVTLLVPHDVAFDRVDKPEDLNALRHLLYGHMIKNRIPLQELNNRSEVTMLNGDKQPVETVNGQVRIGGARILLKNVQARNGVMHIIMPSLPVSEFTPAADSLRTPREALDVLYDPLGLPESKDPVPPKD